MRLLGVLLRNSSVGTKPQSTLLVGFGGQGNPDSIKKRASQYRVALFYARCRGSVFQCFVKRCVFVVQDFVVFRNLFVTGL